MNTDLIYNNLTTKCKLEFDNWRMTGGITHTVINVM